MQSAQGVYLGSEERYVERDPDVALGRQVVDFVWPDFREYPVEALQVQQVAVMGVDLVSKVIDTAFLVLRYRLTADDAVDLVILLQEQLS
jgi:hypothetical protein